MMLQVDVVRRNPEPVVHDGASQHKPLRLRTAQILGLAAGRSDSSLKLVDLRRCQHDPVMDLDRSGRKVVSLVISEDSGELGFEFFETLKKFHRVLVDRVRKLKDLASDQ